MMWVKETLPPRARRRWLLIPIRWSISSFTGSDRTLVAVGTVSEVSIFFAVRIGAPRRTIRSGSSVPAVGRSAGFGGSAGRPAPVRGLLAAPLVSTRDWGAADGATLVGRA